MSDLCSPIYVVMDADEETTFWCFVEVMNRMVSGLARRFLVIIDTFTETKFPPRSERHEATVADIATIDTFHGP
jgi:hypothetical protein